MIFKPWSEWVKTFSQPKVSYSFPIATTGYVAKHSKWDDAEYYFPEDFDTPDHKGYGELIDGKILTVLEKTALILGYKLKITSGIRSILHNRKVGGKTNSAHLIKHGVGHAVDVKTKNSKERYYLLYNAFKYGINRAGIYKSHIHIDSDISLPKNVIWLG